MPHPHVDQRQRDGNFIGLIKRGDQDNMHSVVSAANKTPHSAARRVAKTKRPVRR